jgi:uncharacterized protein
MNLAAKIRRLRSGRDTDTGAPAADPDRVALLSRLDRGGARQRDVAADQRGDAFQLSVGALSAGLSVTEARIVAPRPDAHLDLDRLPDTAGWSADGEWLYLDTETTGLSGGVGTLVFMVGLARWQAPGVLEVRQYTLGRIADEGRFLRAVLDGFGPTTRLVTFNGKSFDMPLLEARCALNRLTVPADRRAHLDLVHPVRRVFRDRWPDCRLQTAERLLLGLVRSDDLPGELAPVAWRRWLRHRDTRELAAVLRHNRQDVISLAWLHRRLVDVYQGDGCFGADPADVGRAWHQAGQTGTAVRIWEGAGPALGTRGRLLLAAEYKRRRDWASAVGIWQGLHADGCPDASSELAKYFEHQLRDYRRAGLYAAHCRHPERLARLERLRLRLEREDAGRRPGQCLELAIEGA